MPPRHELPDSDLHQLGLTLLDDRLPRRVGGRDGAAAPREPGLGRRAIIIDTPTDVYRTFAALGVGAAEPGVPHLPQPAGFLRGKAAKGTRAVADVDRAPAVQTAGMIRQPDRDEIPEEDR